MKLFLKRALQQRLRRHGAPSCALTITPNGTTCCACLSWSLLCRLTFAGPHVRRSLLASDAGYMLANDDMLQLWHIYGCHLHASEAFTQTGMYCVVLNCARSVFSSWPEGRSWRCSCSHNPAALDHWKASARCQSALTITQSPIKAPKSPSGWPQAGRQGVSARAPALGCTMRRHNAHRSPAALYILKLICRVSLRPYTADAKDLRFRASSCHQ